MEFMNHFKIMRKKRKTIALQVKLDGTIEVRVPLQMTDQQIQEFLCRKSGWIFQRLQMLQMYSKNQKLSVDELQMLADQARRVLPKRVAYFASVLGVTYGRITIRNQRSRWGSCSSKGNLNFNCLMMLMPQEVQDYLVVHELCHRKEMNHSVRFWKEVEQVLPNYKEQEMWLKQYGTEIILRLPEKG